MSLNLSQIYEGWKNRLIPASDMKEKIETVSKSRMEICGRCSHFSENRKKTGKFSTMRPDEHCTNCGCTLSAKTRCLSCSCPLNFWKGVMTEEQFDEIRNSLEHEQ